MTTSTFYLSPSEAAQKLGLSVKTLRIYEQRGLITPRRTEVGWRIYGPSEIERAGEIVALRALGFSLAQVAHVLDGDLQELEPTLAAHQGDLRTQLGALADRLERVRALRGEIANGRALTAGVLTKMMASDAPEVAFDLPWPWGGERFKLHALRPLTYIVGPLGCGKTRLAQRLADALPDAAFLGLDRLEDGGQAIRDRLEDDPELARRVEHTLAWLSEEGGAPSDALTTLVVALESQRPAVLVVDMIEQGLSQATQEALMVHLRARPGRRPLIMLTRSSLILNLAEVGPEETILFCPANHSIPSIVLPHPGAPGYESLASCLASPEVRARTAGVIAWRPQVA
ncbi:MerR family transcriptional regulator [Consotaella aegiceratis]|uniref:MerR family transcriptional regulator n=1 Tax=Consotaella aegiceratis TaxID=3097961 RepID=UPI002F403A25